MVEAARPLGSAPQDTSGERRGGKWGGFGVSWLAVQPSSPAHRLCEPRGPQLPHLPNENSHPARTSVLLSLSSPDQLLPCPLHSSAPSPRSGQGSSSNLQPPQRVLAQTYLCHPRGPYSVCRGLGYATVAEKAPGQTPPQTHQTLQGLTAHGAVLDEPLNLTLGGQSAKCNVTSRT